MASHCAGEAGRIHQPRVRRACAAEAMLSGLLTLICQWFVALHSSDTDAGVLCSVYRGRRFRPILNIKNQYSACMNFRISE